MAHDLCRRFWIGSLFPRSGRFSGTFLFAVAALLGASAAMGQTPAQDLPRTPWGNPNLQGMWPSGSVVMVPFERAEELGTRTEFTEEEHAALKERAGRAGA